MRESGRWKRRRELFKKNGREKKRGIFALLLRKKRWSATAGVKKVSKQKGEHKSIPLFHSHTFPHSSPRVFGTSVLPLENGLIAQKLISLFFALLLTCIAVRKKTSSAVIFWNAFVRLWKGGREHTRVSSLLSLFLLPSAPAAKKAIISFLSSFGSLPVSFLPAAKEVGARRGEICYRGNA